MNSNSFEPEIFVLYCGRGLANNNYLPEGTKKADGFKARFIMMPCSSKVETAYVVKLIEQGIDGVILVACPEEQCQFLVGSTRARARVKYARTLLDEAGINATRVGVVHRHQLTSDDIITIAQEHANTVRPLGQNPMRSTR